MTHEYPTGAIRNEDELIFGMLGRTLYGVHGLGRQSFLTVMVNVRNLHTTPGGFSKEGFRKIEYTDCSSDESWDTDTCLGDFNIGNHHNNHYLFHFRKDAEAYLAKAKENTPDIQHDKWDDYDY